jgi:hypothetical protein
LYEDYRQDQPKVKTGLITKAEPEDDVVTFFHFSVYSSRLYFTLVQKVEGRLNNV